MTPRPSPLSVLGLPLLGAFALLTAALGCGGDARVTGTLGGTTLDVGGTAIAWLDQTHYVIGEDGVARLARRAVDETVLHLAFLEAVFSPEVDMRTLSSAERAQIASDISRGDALSLLIRRGDVIRPGDLITSVNTPLPPEILPFVDNVGVALREPTLGSATPYPEVAQSLGNTVMASFAVDQTSPQLEGTVTIAVTQDSAAGGLPNDAALTGEVTVEFSTALLPERLAECNFSRAGQGVDPCDLGNDVGDDINVMVAPRQN